MIDLRDVRMQFEGKKVLDGLSLAVEPQDRLVVMGQSGSGKSTILRLVLGILRPTSRLEIFFKQFEITRLRQPQIATSAPEASEWSINTRRCSVPANVRDNVALPLEELTTKSRGEIDRIVDEKLELVGMQDSRDMMPSQFSGGMRKRVSLARALVMEPEADSL